MGEKGLEGVDERAERRQLAERERADEVRQERAEDAGQEPSPQSSGPNVGEIVGDILDPIGIHKLF